jgi:allantoinase
LVIDLVIKGGKVVTPYGVVDVSVGIDEGRIVSITRDIRTPAADRILDAKGQLVLPGVIDMHVHFRDPGFPEREDFETGTRAAAAGGVTTVADMPNTVPSVTSVEALEEKVGIVGRKALIDFALIGGAGALSRETLRSLANEGVAGFKTFLISRFEELAATDGQMLDNFAAIAETGRPCLVHAENEDIVARWQEKARALGRLDPPAHAEFRPAIAEVEATFRTILLAAETSAHLHVCHMTAKGAVDALYWAKNKGIQVTGETSPNYLFLAANAMEKLGPFAKIDPPLRGPKDQASLWRALRDGTIDAVASDHAPYEREEKEKGWTDIFKAPSGGVGVETMLPLMLDSINKGLIGLERLVEICSTNPAKILGLHPRKGVILVGADADMVLVDMDRKFTIRGEDLHSKQKTTAFEGFQGIGLPQTVIVRGVTVVEDEEITGKPGYGIFQRPT